MRCVADASVVLKRLAMEECAAVIAERLRYHSAVIANRVGEVGLWRPSAFGN